MWKWKYNILKFVRHSSISAEIKIYNAKCLHKKTENISGSITWTLISKTKGEESKQKEEKKIIEDNNETKNIKNKESQWNKELILSKCHNWQIFI